MIGFPEVHGDSEIWSQTLWSLRRSLGSDEVRVAGDPRDGARARQPVVPRHAQRDPARRHRRTTRVATTRRSGRCSPPAAWASTPAASAAATAHRAPTSTVRRRAPVLTTDHGSRDRPRRPGRRRHGDAGVPGLRRHEPVGGRPGADGSYEIDNVRRRHVPEDRGHQAWPPRRAARGRRCPAAVPPASTSRSADASGGRAGRSGRAVVVGAGAARVDGAAVGRHHAHRVGAAAAPGPPRPHRAAARRSPGRRSAPTRSGRSRCRRARAASSAPGRRARRAPARGRRRAPRPRG